LNFDTQSIDVSIGAYLAGFADGEGSFNVSFRRRTGEKFRWKVSLCFNVSQRDRTVLDEFKRTLDCGTMRARRDGVWYYEVNDLAAIKSRVIPFFIKFPFISVKKRRDFAKFVEIAELITKREHLTDAGVRRILEIRSEMNDGGAGRRKYSDAQILEAINSGKSSETTRQANTIANRQPLMRS
jgi:hypothetical protein